MGGFWRSYYNIPKAIFYLQKVDYSPQLAQPCAAVDALPGSKGSAVARRRCCWVVSRLYIPRAAVEVLDDASSWEEGAKRGLLNHFRICSDGGSSDISNIGQSKSRAKSLVIA